MADVAGAHQAVDHLLVAAARVALELEAVADEDPPDVGPARPPARPSESYSRTTAPNGTRPARAGRRAKVLGRRERRVRDLGRAVEVVELVADRPPGPANELGLELRAASRTRSAASSCRSVPADPRARPTIRCSITGTTTSAVGRCAVDRLEHALGLEPPLDDRRAPERRRQRHLREPERRGTSARPRRSPRARDREPSTAERRSAPSERPCSRGAPFGVPVVPLVSSTTRRGRGRRRWPLRPRTPPISASSESRRPRLAVGPPEQPAVTRLDRRHEPVVLLVVHEQRDALALAHVAQLRPGEVGVQVQRSARRPSRPRT